MSASTLPEFWRTFKRRPARPPIDWRSIRVIAALAVASGALVVSGITQHEFGAPGLGWGMIGAGVVVFVAAAQGRW